MAITIIAEAGISHSGNIDTALRMVDAAKRAGADIVKYQTFCPEESINEKHKDFAFLKALALTHIDFLKLSRHCEEVGIEFMSTPGDLSSLKFLTEECGVKRIKIGSDDLTYVPLLKEASKTGLPIILSTGMATLSEIDNALQILRSHKVILLHCVSSYPCKLMDANLSAITTLQNEFVEPVGYSDHCRGMLACVVAASLGAVIIEKHFELSTHKGPDTDVSISDWVLEKMIERIREVEVMLGSGVKEPCEAEKKLMPLVRKGEDGKKCA